MRGDYIMPILDDSFKISDYIKGTDGHSRINSSAANDAIEWANNAIRTIILPTDNLEDLEDQWIKFNSMIKKHRRESDWKSLELFGMTNQDHYEKQRSELLKSRDIHNDISDGDNLIESDDIPVTESFNDINYLDSYYNFDAIHYTTLEVEQAKTWAKESNRIIIIPTRTLQELEDLWDSYNAMIKKHRRESDWKSEELFGVTNLKHYEYLKSQFLSQDISEKDMDTYGSLVESFVVPDSSTIIREYLLGICDTEPRVDIARSLLEMVMPKRGICEELLTNNIVSDVMDTYGDLFNGVPTIDIPYGDLPFVSPEEMIDMGVYGQSPQDNFYGVLADNSRLNDDVDSKSWFEAYRNSRIGFNTEFSALSSDWVNKVRELMFGLNSIKESGDENAILARKQSILELGWDPEIEFTDKARSLAQQKAASKIMKEMTYTRFIDVRNMHSSIITESSSSNLKPVFLVFTEGKSYFSNTVKKFTHSEYSHASIAFDSSLKKMYSYNMKTEANGIGGGFLEESIENLKDFRLGVYMFFVSSKIYESMLDTIRRYKNNIKNTSYSSLNVLTLPFNIPLNREWKLICSQFVDRCLKLADIDITKKNSGVVTPEDLIRASKQTRNIYFVFDGLGKSYKQVKTDNLIRSLKSKNVEPLKESRYFSNEKSYVRAIAENIHDISMLRSLREYSGLIKDNNIKRILEEVVFYGLDIKPYIEAKEFPVQFDKDGNLLIKNIKKLDYEAEYSKSHKLMKQYSSSGNINGIKYELSKLWMMIQMIEEELHSKKSNKLTAEGAYKARAKMLNDFQYYMKEVLDKEPDFNFSAYYDDSPFSSAATKINSTTISALSSLIKRFVKPL